MAYNFDNERPIYIQLVEMVKMQIISGKLKSGEKLPSVREYANDVKVNPNTMQKALQELEREKLIYTERTNGKYVTDDKKLIGKYKHEMAKDIITNFVKDMHDIGIEKDEIINYIKTEGNDKNDINWMQKSM